MSECIEPVVGLILRWVLGPASFGTPLGPKAMPIKDVSAMTVTGKQRRTSSAFGTPGDQSDVLAFLDSGVAFGGIPPKRIDTHCASIFLAGPRAWKLKRAVRFGYLDFSTPERRHAALEAELRLNRRTAPDLYLDVRPIARNADGELSIGGAGEATDWLLEMQRFPDDALLSHRADREQLDEHLLVRLADRISAFHAAAETATAQSASASFRRVVEGNIASMAAFPEILDRERTNRLGLTLLELADAMASRLDARGKEGRVRHVHGDLHLGNIALIDGEPTLFDCLEFSTDLATTDVLYDLAFLLMDLWQRDLRSQANIVFNRYFDLSPQDESGLALLPLFLSVRATVRAHVIAAQSQRASGDPALARMARSYLDLALEMLAPALPRLVAIGGLSGTGKSSLARRLGGVIGRVPGARIFRTDVLRKRLAGLSPEDRLPSRSYSAQAAAQVYDELDSMCARALADGQSVVADGVFARRDERDRIEALAHRSAIAFDGLWLQAGVAERLNRVGSRDADASDADSAVVMSQAGLVIGALGSWHCVEAGGPLDEVAALARTQLKL
jgi:aminoglycoside phosphotransferase family enzyme/predicted kinase